MLLLLVLSVPARVVYYYFTDPLFTVPTKPFTALEALAEDHVLSAGEVAADAAQLVSLIESSHPAVSLHAVPGGYADAKARFLDATGVDMTVSAFRFLAMEYLAALGDGHTGIRLPITAFLPVRWKAAEETLLILDGESLPTGQVVTHIGGMPVAEVFAAIDRLLPYENEFGRARNHAVQATTKEVLEYAGADTRAPVAHAYRQSDGQLAETSIPFVYIDSDEDAGEDEPSLAFEMIGDVAYLDFNQCKYDDTFTQAKRAFADAVRDGARKVIIDARGNPGGTTATCTALLDAMSMEAPLYGLYVRFSPLARERNGHLRTSGSYEESPDITTARANPEITLAVLTDVRTYSAATVLGVRVQDGKLGVVIGQTSANSPNCYGDILYFQLDHSRLTGYVSYKRMLRPDTQADPRALTPDIPVEDGVDSLEVALAYLGK